jgi:hypothetical protein
LPAYLAHGQVAIIPWKVNKITQATSPLKVFEYVAMYRPVIAPMLPALQKIPGVFLAQDQDEFVDLVGKARNAKLDTAAMSVFVKNNNWQNRVEKIVEYVNKRCADVQMETVYNHIG